ncbi:SDR family oxidoreductase [Flagellatimonas centrodinii]|uniref:SDR family NAD(P)-dependent oxidoreductase n=1 Tax=Flagellatimonas centrodinii TaxID=2806210 RepID=UPI001FEE056A|nr:SDR family oxidoreductase [Flagellatimonas centrodinii]ULQ46533.1 SDR family oxidoreductase [Flagellatimonas centrodinii]
MPQRPLLLITGAGGGIGRATAERAAAAGYEVAASDRNVEALDATVAAIRATGGEAEAWPCDIGDAVAVAGLFAGLRDRYGRLDAAFNNAGVGGSGGVGLADTDDEAWEAALRVNLSGTYHCLKHEIRWMRETGGGAIVNNSSVLGINGGISAPYTATKHAIAGLTKSAALSYGGDGIRVNAVCPGFINAGMGLNLFSRHAEATRAVIGQLPLPRPGSADEVADAVLWLCSPAAGYVTGTLLPVDGGFSAR